MLNILQTYLIQSRIFAGQRYKIYSMFKKIKFGVVALVMAGSLFSMTGCIEDRAEFAVFVNGFVQEYCQILPDESPLTPKNPLLTRTFIPDENSIDQLRAFAAEQSNELQRYDLSELNQRQVKDYRNIQNVLKKINNYLKGYQTNPTFYNCQYSLQRVLNERKLPVEKRLEILTIKLRQIPAYYEVARQNVQQSNNVMSYNAIQQHIKTYKFLDRNLTQAYKNANWDTPETQDLLFYAKIAVKEYIAYCEHLRHESQQNGKSMPVNYQ